MPINYGQGFKEGGGQMEIESITDRQGRNVFGTAGGDPYTFDPYSSPLPDALSGYLRIGADPLEMMNTGTFYPQAGFTPDQAIYDPTYGWLAPKSVMDQRNALVSQAGVLGQPDFMSTYGPAVIAALIGGGMALGGAGEVGAGAGAAVRPESYWGMTAGNSLGGTMTDAGLGASGLFEGATGGAGALGGAGAFAGAGGAAGGAGGSGGLFSSVMNYFSTPSGLSALSSLSGIANSLSQSSAANNAAGAQSAASMAQIAESQRQFQAIRDLLKGYSDAGMKSLGAQQDLLGLNGAQPQQDAITGLQNSPMFTSMTKAGEDAILQNASATGNLRGGNVQRALSQYRPALLAQLIESQYGKLGGLTAIGQNAAAGTGNAVSSTGAAINNALGEMGAAQAGNALAQGRANSSIFSGIGGGLGLFSALNRGNSSNNSLPWDAPLFGGVDPWGET